MAWDFIAVSAAVETTVAGGNITLNEPSGAAQGDLLVACIAYRSNAAFTLPSGWALVATQQSSGDIDATNGIASGVMAYIVRGASAPSYVFTRTGGDVARGTVVCYRGNHATPYDTGSANTLGATSVTVTTGTITTAEANELIVAMGAGGDNYTWSAFDAATDPATASGATDTTTEPTAGTWIERHDSGSGTGADTSLAIADAIRSTAGATGQMQVTSSGAGRSVMIAGAFKISASVEVLIDATVPGVGSMANLIGSSGLYAPIATVAEMPNFMSLGDSFYGTIAAVGSLPNFLASSIGADALFSGSGQIAGSLSITGLYGSFAGVGALDAYVGNLMPIDGIIPGISAFNGFVSSAGLYGSIDTQGQFILNIALNDSFFVSMAAISTFNQLVGLSGGAHSQIITISQVQAALNAISGLTAQMLGTGDLQALLGAIGLFASAGGSVSLSGFDALYGMLYSTAQGIGAFNGEIALGGGGPVNVAIDAIISAQGILSVTFELPNIFTISIRDGALYPIDLSDGALYTAARNDDALYNMSMRNE